MPAPMPGPPTRAVPPPPRGGDARGRSAAGGRHQRDASPGSRRGRSRNRSGSQRRTEGGYRSRSASHQRALGGSDLPEEEKKLNLTAMSLLRHHLQEVGLSNQSGWALIDSIRTTCGRNSSYAMLANATDEDWKDLAEHPEFPRVTVVRKGARGHPLVAVRAIDGHTTPASIRIGITTDSSAASEARCAPTSAPT